MEERFKVSLLRNFLCCIVFLSGCETLASKEAAIGCQAADIISTERALRLNPNAYETNSIPINGLIALKLALMGFIYFWKDWDNAPKELRAFVTVVGCAPVPGNIRAAHG